MFGSASLSPLGTSPEPAPDRDPGVDPVDPVCPAAEGTCGVPLPGTVVPPGSTKRSTG
jgi:hypothetical protein